MESELRRFHRHTDQSTLWGWALQENLDAVRRSLTDVNQTDDEGCTALHVAAARGNVDLFDLLLRRGDDDCLHRS